MNIASLYSKLSCTLPDDRITHYRAQVAYLIITAVLQAAFIIIIIYYLI